MGRGHPCALRLGHYKTLIEESGNLHVMIDNQKCQRDCHQCSLERCTLKILSLPKSQSFFMFMISSNRRTCFKKATGG